jgi:hypothetical protein
MPLNFLIEEYMPSQKGKAVNLIKRFREDTFPEVKDND